MAANPAIRYARQTNLILRQRPNRPRKINPAAREPKIAPTVLTARRCPIILPGTAPGDSAAFRRYGKTLPRIIPGIRIISMAAPKTASR